MNPMALAMAEAMGATVEGTWRAPDAAQVSETVRAAVELAVTESVSVAERPVARWLLLRATRPCGTVEVDLHEPELSIRCDGQQTAVAPTDGTPVPFQGADGRALTLVHAVVDGSTVTQSFGTVEGTRTNRLTVRPDGTLEVAVTVRSRRLAEPVAYTLTYQR
jgi:hypothetical protein